MTSIQRKPMHSWQIIMLSTGVGILLALAASWVLSIHFQEPPSRISPPPSKAEAILGAKNFGFGSTILFVRDIDGKSYQYVFGKWEPLFIEPVDFYDEECQQSEIQNIEAVAGRIKNCREIQTAGEWIPAPRISYAITADGDLRQLSTSQLVKMLTILILIILTLLGLCIGFIIVIARRITSTTSHNRHMLTVPFLIILTLLGLCLGFIIIIIISIISKIF